MRRVQLRIAVQVELHEAIGDQRPEGLYDAALAHMAAGFRARSPSLIVAAEALLTELEGHAVRAGWIPSSAC